jgi:hypothetical protein
MKANAAPPMVPPEERGSDFAGEGCENLIVSYPIWPSIAMERPGMEPGNKNGPSGS